MIGSLSDGGREIETRQKRLKEFIALCRVRLGNL